jgi:hypothetical protein
MTNTVALGAALALASYDKQILSNVISDHIHERYINQITSIKEDKNAETHAGWHPINGAISDTCTHWL